MLACGWRLEAYKVVKASDLEDLEDLEATRESGSINQRVTSFP